MTEEKPTTPENAVTPAPQNEVVPDDFFGNDGFEGEIDQNVIRTPYLSLVHGVGALSEAGFTPGSLIFNKEVEMAVPVRGEMQIKDGISVTLLKGFSEYIEDVSQDEYKAGIKARHFRKESEARAAGLISVKERRGSGDAEARVFRPASTWKVLMQGKGTEGFPLEFEGKNYTLAALGLTKGSHWGAGVVVLNFVNECRMLKKPLHWKSFQLFTKQEKFPGSTNAVWSIKAAAGQKHSDEFQKWVSELGV